MSETKQIIVMRKDLKMRRGKEIAQGSHASMAFMTRKLESVNLGAVLNGVYHKLLLSLAEMKWLSESFTKVCLQVDSEEALMDIYDKAKAAKLVVHLVTDAGLTEFNGVPTKTCLAIGPDYAEKIDPITGHLKLY